MVNNKWFYDNYLDSDDELDSDDLDNDNELNNDDLDNNN